MYAVLDEDQNGVEGTIFDLVQRYLKLPACEIVQMYDVMCDS